MVFPVPLWEGQSGDPRRIQDLAHRQLQAEDREPPAARDQPISPVHPEGIIYIKRYKFKNIGQSRNIYL